MPTSSSRSVITVVLDGTEGYSTQSVYLENMLLTGGVGDDEDVGFFARADLVADGVDCGLFEESVKGEVV